MSLMEWIDSEGGPLVLVPEAALGAWTGCAGADYDRACGTDGHLGLLDVGGAQALVLGEEPASTTYLPEQGLLLRWVAAESEEAVLAALPRALRLAAWEPETVWEVAGGPVYLFDAGWTGAESAAEGRLRLDLAAGRHRVRAAYVEPDGETSVMLVRLGAVDAASEA
ncbi:Imm21 family immunity protein [Kitasatospora sp. NPDC056446]|uniref:Imm21 family immunity protein n=1 Tax=Kitasatospora sp. NPDC056446 TaxID=3345819 RepID=UPI00368BCFB8